MRVRRFLHLILLLGACGLVWQVWSTWSHLRPPHVTPSPSSLDTPVPTVSPARPRIGRKLSRRVTAKDLFSPERRPAKKEAPKQAEEPSVPPPEHLKLVGVFLANGQQEAFFADASKGGKVVRVPTGGTLESYQLTRPDPRCGRPDPWPGRRGSQPADRCTTESGRGQSRPQDLCQATETSRAGGRPSGRPGSTSGSACLSIGAGRRHTPGCSDNDAECVGTRRSSLHSSRYSPTAKPPARYPPRPRA